MSSDGSPGRCWLAPDALSLPFRPCVPAGLATAAGHLCSSPALREACPARADTAHAPAPWVASPGAVLTRATGAGHRTRVAEDAREGTSQTSGVHVVRVEVENPPFGHRMPLLPVHTTLCPLITAHVSRSGNTPPCKTQRGSQRQPR